MIFFSTKDTCSNVTLATTTQFVSTVFNFLLLSPTYFPPSKSPRLIQIHQLLSSNLFHQHSFQLLIAPAIFVHIISKIHRVNSSPIPPTLTHQPSFLTRYPPPPLSSPTTRVSPLPDAVSPSPSLPLNFPHRIPILSSLPAPKPQIPKPKSSTESSIHWNMYSDVLSSIRDWKLPCLLCFYSTYPNCPCREDSCRWNRWFGKGPRSLVDPVKSG